MGAVPERGRLRQRPGAQVPAVVVGSRLRHERERRPGAPRGDEARGAGESSADRHRRHVRIQHHSPVDLPAALRRGSRGLRALLLLPVHRLGRPDRPAARHPRRYPGRDRLARAPDPRSRPLDAAFPAQRGRWCPRPCRRCGARPTLRACKRRSARSEPHHRVGAGIPRLSAAATRTEGSGRRVHRGAAIPQRLRLPLHQPESRRGVRSPRRRVRFLLLAAKAGLCLALPHHLCLSRQATDQRGLDGRL